jgi:hypothetical protein
MDVVKELVARGAKINTHMKVHVSNPCCAEKISLLQVGKYLPDCQDVDINAIFCPFTHNIFIYLR